MVYVFDVLNVATDKLISICHVALQVEAVRYTLVCSNTDICSSGGQIDNSS